ncbi:MAG: HAMP domain-containing histidine kinase [Ruminococcaceae bacterium]|nr:HAMP domain-containing histidine kinase [Oscillospiraceae bacterium]
MTEKVHPKGRRLSSEILALLAICFVISFLLFHILRICAAVAVEGFLVARELALTDTQLTAMDGWVFNLSLLISVWFFVFLFLFLLGERLSYIRDIVKGIDALRAGQMDHQVPVEGFNELTRLAEAVNYLSATQRQVREKDRALAEEKEQLIRTLSHDIRTPLTSIMAYSEFLASHDSCTEQEHRAYVELIQKKAQQIKELTDILLDGGKRNLEHFEDARLLIEQLAAEFEESLEEKFQVAADLSDCLAFGGSFDVQELRRIFDNLSSNVRKYADREKPVELHIRSEASELVIRQKNAKRIGTDRQESYQMGLNSIRRIAHNYGGQVEIRQEDDAFEITVTLSEF